MYHHAPDASYTCPAPISRFIQKWGPLGNFRDYGCHHIILGVCLYTLQGDEILQIGSPKHQTGRLRERVCVCPYHLSSQRRFRKTTLFESDVHWGFTSVWKMRKICEDDSQFGINLILRLCQSVSNFFCRVDPSMFLHIARFNWRKVTLITHVKLSPVCGITCCCLPNIQ